jgi:hypothetical protein
MAQYNHADQLPCAFKVVENRGRQCCVDGYNVAVEHATGQIIILNSDDMFPPEYWDAALLSLIHDVNADFVIHVSTGNPRDVDLITLQMLSARRYKRLGYALYPEYQSLFADDEFTHHAYQDNAVVDARSLVFEHRHPGLGKAMWDEVYAHENNPAFSAHGRELFERRKKERFPKWLQ